MASGQEGLVKNIRGHTVRCALGYFLEGGASITPGKIRTDCYCRGGTLIETSSMHKGECGCKKAAKPHLPEGLAAYMTTSSAKKKKYHPGFCRTRRFVRREYIQNTRFPSPCQGENAGDSRLQNREAVSRARGWAEGEKRTSSPRSKMALSRVWRRRATWGMGPSTDRV
jgi:hypothetical protein